MTRKGLVWSFLLLLVVSAGLLMYPLMVIQPFKRQDESPLRVALWMIRWRPYFEAVAVFAALAGLVRFWQMQVKIWPRILASFSVLLVCVAAALSTVNIFEIMFHRYDKPAFARVSDAKLDADDKVLAITVNGAARAYPIRSIAYHHIINDEVGGQPVVATY